MLRCPNGLRRVILDVLVDLWKENNIFEFFRVRHANRGWTKYGINIGDGIATNRRCWSRVRLLRLEVDLWLYGLGTCRARGGLGVVSGKVKRDGEEKGENSPA